MSLVGLILLLVFFTGCGVKQTGDGPVTLTVSAAASLKDTLTEINGLYTDQNPQVKVTLNSGGSGSLQQQIEQGAPVDIFISAAPAQMDALESKELLEPATRRDLLKNRVVLIAPLNSSLTGFAHLVDDQVKKLALGEPQSVPAGKYSQEILTKLELWEKVKSKTVYAKDVRQVLTYVETGDVEAGIVYATDSQTSSQVKVIAFAPEDTHAPVVYPAAVLISSNNKQAALEFLRFLGGEESKKVFEKYGFTFIAP